MAIKRPAKDRAERELVDSNNKKLQADREIELLETLLQMLDNSSMAERAEIFKEFSDRLAADTSGRSWRHLIRLMHDRAISAENYYSIRVNMPVSFSKTSWSDVRQLYNLKTVRQIPTMTPETLYISNVVRRKVFKGIDEVEKTTCALADATNEAKIVVWSNAVIKRILLQFEGNISNDAEGRLPSTALSSGGYVEFIFTVLELCVVVVMEGKRQAPTNDNYAQLMVELESAYYQNIRNGLSIDRVQGIICSQRMWEFWEYDGKQFSRSSPYLILAASDIDTIKAQLKLFDVLYAVFFQGYIMSLKALILRSKQTAAAEGKTARRPSEERWATALNFAERAYTLAKAANTDEEFDAVSAVLKESFDALPEEHVRVMTNSVAVFDSYLANEQNAVG